MNYAINIPHGALFPRFNFRRFTTVLLLALSACSLKAAEPFISPETAAYEFRSELPPPQVRIGVKISDANFRPSATPIIAGVTVAGRPQPKVLSGLKAEWVTNSVGKPYAIDLSYTTTNDPVLPGSYDVRVEIPVGTEVEVLKTTLNKPAPVLAVSSKITITQVAWSPLSLLFRSESKSPTTLDETSRAAAVTGLKYRATTDSSPASDSITGGLDFSASPSSLGAGMGTTLSYATVGDFPLGSTVGSVKVLAAESAAPLVTIGFEVKRRLSRFWLLVILGIGLLSSYGLKTIIERNITRDQVMLQAASLLEQITDMETRHRDQGFIRVYADQVVALKRAQQSGDSVEISKAMTDLTTAWTSAQQILIKDREVQETANSAFNALLASCAAVAVPGELLTAVADAQAQSGAFGDAMNYDDFQTVRKLQQEIVQKLSNALNTSLETWLSPLGDCIDAMAQGSEGISPAIKAVATTRQPALKKLITDAEDSLNHAQPTVDDLKKIADQFFHIRFESDRLFRDFVGAYRNEGLTAINNAANADANVWPPPRLDEVKLTLSELIEILLTTTRNPNGQDLRTKLVRYQNAWTKALPQNLQTPAVISAIKNGEFLRALDLALASAPVPAQAGFVAIEESSAPPPAFPMTEASSLLKPASPYPTNPTPQMTSSRKTGEVSSGRIRMQMEKDMNYRRLGLSALALVVGFGVFANTWLGTYSEFSVAFFWAFGLDLSLDGVLKATKRPEDSKASAVGPK